MREVQDRTKESKEGSRRARTSEGWTRDISDEGSVNQDWGSRVQVNWRDLGPRWWIRRFKAPRGS